VLLLVYVWDGKAVGGMAQGGLEESGSVVLTSIDGARLTGRIDGGTLAGTVVLRGGASPLAFSASSVESPAGLDGTEAESVVNRRRWVDRPGRRPPTRRHPHHHWVHQHRYRPGSAIEAGDLVHAERDGLLRRGAGSRRCV
jgi:hypothetical protein